MSSELDRLPDLAAEINRESELAERAWSSALRHAIRAGELLIQAKAQVRHGKWLPWLRENFERSERTAQLYMSLARNPQRVAGLSSVHAAAAISFSAEKERIEIQRPSVEWYSPALYVKAGRRVLGGTIDLDPASCAEANQVVQAKRFYTREQDGLSLPWYGRIWLNPPYGGMAALFVDRLIAELALGEVTAAIIVANAKACDAKWFQPLWNGVLCFADHRIDFTSGDGQPGSRPNHGTVFAYFGPDEGRFADEFRAFGVIVRRWERP
jgi:hypothetical protein